MIESWRVRASRGNSAKTRGVAMLWCARILLVSLTLLAVISLCSGSNELLPKNLIAVPLYYQQTDYSCGPAAALSLLRYWSWDRFSTAQEEELYGPMNTSSSTGTDPQPIADYFTNI